MKTEENELYIQVDKDLDALGLINDLEVGMFGEIGESASEFQLGVPDSNVHLSETQHGRTINIVTSETRIHIIINGSIDVEKLKEVIFKTHAL